jgi:hypothetical protein
MDANDQARTALLQDLFTDWFSARQDAYTDSAYGEGWKDAERELNRDAADYAARVRSVFGIELTYTPIEIRPTTRRRK